MKPQNKDKQTVNIFKTLNSTTPFPSFFSQTIMYIKHVLCTMECNVVVVGWMLAKKKPCDNDDIKTG